MAKNEVGRSGQEGGACSGPDGARTHSGVGWKGVMEIGVKRRSAWWDDLVREGREGRRENTSEVTPLPPSSVHPSSLFLQDLKDWRHCECA